MIIYADVKFRKWLPDQHPCDSEVHHVRIELNVPKDPEIPAVPWALETVLRGFHNLGAYRLDSISIEEAS